MIEKLLNQKLFGTASLTFTVCISLCHIINFFFFFKYVRYATYDIGLPLWKTVAKESFLIVVHTF